MSDREFWLEMARALGTVIRGLSMAKATIERRYQTEANGATKAR